jgi:hypothetical protein
VLPAHRDILRLQELHQPFVRAFTANARLLHTTKRRSRIRNKAPIYSDHAEVELFLHSHAAAQILGVEIGDEAILRVIGAPDHVFLGFERLQRGHRSEDLFIEHFGIV